MAATSMSDAPRELFEYQTVDEDELVDQKQQVRIGRAFETYVVLHFDKNQFQLKEWRSDRKAGPHFAQSNQDPDLKWGYLADNARPTYYFAVECKYRSQWRVNKHGTRYINWCGRNQRARYIAYAKSNNICVFVTIGVGRSADHPDRIFIIPLSYFNSDFASENFLEGFRSPDPRNGFAFSPDRQELRQIAPTPPAGLLKYHQQSGGGPRSSDYAVPPHVAAAPKPRAHTTSATLPGKTPTTRLPLRPLAPNAPAPELPEARQTRRISIIWPIIITSAFVLYIVFPKPATHAPPIQPLAREYPLLRRTPESTTSLRPITNDLSPTIRPEDISNKANPPSGSPPKILRRFNAPLRPFNFAYEKKAVAVETQIEQAMDRATSIIELYADDAKPQFLAIEVDPAATNQLVGYMIFDVRHLSTVDKSLYLAGSRLASDTVASLDGHVCLFVAPDRGQ